MGTRVVSALLKGFFMPGILFKELRYRILYLPFSLLAFELSFAVYNSYEYLEFGYFLFPVICCGMLFYSKDEIELIRTSGTRLFGVVLIRYLVTYFYMILLPVLRLMFLGGEIDWKAILSLVTTVLFSTSFSLLHRVLFQNPYATALFSVFTHTLFVFSFRVILTEVFEVSAPKALQRFSPFGSHTITNMGVYGNNRWIVTGVAVFVIALAMLILWRRETFYKE